VTKITEPAHGIIYSPNKLRVIRSFPDPRQMLALVTRYLEYPLNDQQTKAFCRSFTDRLYLLWGPPGTGKTAVVAATALGWMEQAWVTRSDIKIGVGASNYHAIDNVLTEVADLLDRRKKIVGKTSARIARVRSDSQSPPQDCRLEDIKRTSSFSLRKDLISSEGCIVVGGTWMQLGKMAEAASADKEPSGRWFDLLILDEASQIPVSFAAAYFLLLKEDGHTILAGDHCQLGPVYKFQMQDIEKHQGLYDCIFSYIQKAHKIEPEPLDFNFRTNSEISGWPKEKFYKKGYEAYYPTRRLNLKLPATNFKPPSEWPDILPWSDQFIRILDPSVPVVVISYETYTSTLSNLFEAQIATALALLYYRIQDCQGNCRDYKNLWVDQLGIITPHRAQMSTIRNLLIEAGLPRDPPPFVDTVDRFQGQERDLIIASYSVADKDYVAKEAKFILESRRFNVTLTRARSKFIMLVSDAILHCLPEDAEIAEDAVYLQMFPYDYCTDLDERLDLPYFEEGQSISMPCRFRGKNKPP
jgi:hypothetical protein